MIRILPLYKMSFLSWESPLASWRAIYAQSTCQRADGAMLPQQLFVSPGKALFFFVLNQKLPTEWKGKPSFFWGTHSKVGHVASRHFSCTTSGPDLTYFHTFNHQMAQMAWIAFQHVAYGHQSQSNVVSRLNSNMNHGRPR